MSALRGCGLWKRSRSESFSATAGSLAPPKRCCQPSHELAPPKYSSPIHSTGWGFLYGRVPKPGDRTVNGGRRGRRRGRNRRKMLQLKLSSLEISVAFAIISVANATETSVANATEPSETVYLTLP